RERSVVLGGVLLAGLQDVRGVAVVVEAQDPGDGVDRSGPANGVDRDVVVAGLERADVVAADRNEAVVADPVPLAVVGLLRALLAGLHGGGVVVVVVDADNADDVVNGSGSADGVDRHVVVAGLERADVVVVDADQTAVVTHEVPVLA